MGRYNKKKEPISKFSSNRKEVRARENPNSIYGKNPSWSFSACDKEGSWAFSKDRLIDDFWERILPKLREFEKTTWGSILLDGKKSHHHISVSDCNKCAIDRLMEIGVFEDELLSLRLGGNLRLYGYLSESTYVIIWYDNDHGDNNSCVCRSHKKHT